MRWEEKSLDSDVWKGVSVVFLLASAGVYLGYPTFASFHSVTYTTLVEKEEALTQ